MPEMNYRSTSRLILGLSVITIGVLFTLGNLGIVDAHEALRWWPVALIAYGVTRLAGLGRQHSLLSGTIFTVAGVWLLLNHFHIIDASFWDLWPALLVIWGIAIVSGRGKFFGVTYNRRPGWKTYDRYDPNADVSVGAGFIRGSRERGGATGGVSGGDASGGSSGAGASGGWTGGEAPGSAEPRRSSFEDSSPNFSSVAFMGSVARKVVTQEFRGGDVAAMMGGGDIDLRSARMAEGTARIEVNLVMGGVNLFVPEDWSVEFQGMPILGSVEDRSKHPAGEPKGRLIITGVVLMSSIIIRN